MPRVEIRDGGVYKLRSALSGEVIAFSRTDAEGVKVRTHLDTNADGQMWEATFTGGQTFKGEKFFKLKTLDKRGGTDYYLGYSSSEAGQPVVARTTGEEWIFQPESGSGEMYFITSVKDSYEDSWLILTNGLKAQDDASLELSGDLVGAGNAGGWMVEEVSAPHS